MADEEFRAHLIEVGRDAMGRNDGWRWWHPRHLARLLDFWEPLIRKQVAEEIAQALETDLQTSHWHKWVDEEGDEDPYGSIVIHGDDQVRSDAAAIARRVGGAS